MDVTPQAIRAVQFREKLRGYHPDDVDAFVAAVAKGVEDLEARVRQAESRATEIETRQTGTNEAEESLRRTLVLAQRTADAAIQEAREEAARVTAETEQQRAAAEAELAELRQRLHGEAEQESRTLREELATERAALQADIAALTAHLERERERLRIYFTDQLRRVEEGEPGVAPAPPMQAADTTPAPTVGTADGIDPSGPSSSSTEETAGSGPADDGRLGAGFAHDPVDGDDARAGAGTDGPATTSSTTPTEDEDPFLAELRRAVTDDRPLGPREDEPAKAAGDDADDDGFDLFAKSDDDDGRFGSKRRFRR